MANKEILYPKPKSNNIKSNVFVWTANKMNWKDALAGIAFWLDAHASQLASVLDGFNRNRTPQHTKTRRKLRSIVDNILRWDFRGWSSRRALYRTLDTDLLDWWWLADTKI